MFSETNLRYILVPALFIITGMVLILRFAIGRKSDPRQKAIQSFKIMTVASGAFLILLSLLLPSTPALSTFGYPESVRDIESSEQMLRLMQRYNRAIVRNTEVLHWFLFVFVFWFLAALYTLANVLVVSDSKDKSP